MNTLITLAVTFAALALPVFAQGGVYTDTQCSCSLFEVDLNGECLRLVSPGQCLAHSQGCKPGYKCDLVGTELCNHKPCSTLSRTHPVTGPSSTIPCSPKPSICVSRTDAMAPLPSPAPANFCVFTDTECTCAMSPASSAGQCVRLGTPASGATSAQCFFGDCAAGYRCDCDGTETCSRSSCQKWTVLTANQHGNFDCALSNSVCTEKKQVIERYTATDI